MLGWWVDGGSGLTKPILVFSLAQAEQYNPCLCHILQCWLISASIIADNHTDLPVKDKFPRLKLQHLHLTSKLIYLLILPLT